LKLKLRYFAVASGASLAFTLLPSFAQAATTSAGGPFAGPTAAPVSVNLGGAQSSAGNQQPSKPFLHSGGQGRLDQQKAEAQALGGPQNVQVAGTGAGTSAPTVPSPGPGWDGISAAESSCNCLPPDGAVASSGTQIVGAVNTAFKVWTNTAGLLKGPTALKTLFSPNPGCKPNDSDPFADYDSSGHFILGALTYDSSNNSSICVAVSKTADASAGTWWVYSFPGPSRDLLDYPREAIGSDAVYVSVNQFQNATTFLGARVYAYQKAQMLIGATALSKVFDPKIDAAGKLPDTLIPTRGVTVANTMYFDQADDYATTGQTVSLWKWTNPFGASSFTLQGGIGVTPYTTPVNATQPSPGNPITTNDMRTEGGHYYNGTVYGSHTISCKPGGSVTTVTCIQWFQIGNLDGSPTKTQEGIWGSPGEFRFFSNLAVDKNGNMTLAYAHSSGLVYAGIKYAGRVPSDALGTLQPETVLKAGETTINGSRYGDYAGMVVDPDGCTVRHLEEYAKTGALWGTWVSSISSCALAPAAVSASPSTVNPGGTVTATWSGITNPTATDWIALHLSGSSNTDHITWVYTNGAASGSISVPVYNSVSPGTYELRLFRQDTYERLAVSNPITVAVVSGTLSASPSTVHPGGTVTATWSITNPTATDWIALHLSGSSNTDHITWVYTTGAASGSISIPVYNSVSPGTYELRLFRQDTYERLAVSNPITIS
jgi:hypothetical protein